MIRKVLGAILFFAVASLCGAEPTVDGKVVAGEYATTKKVIGSAGQLSCSPDGKGGYFWALTVPGKGWAAIGLGSSRMNGASIYLGFIGDDGKPVFSEQAGRGHTHKDTGKQTVDLSSVTRVKGKTTIEFHIPAAQWSFKGKDLPFIVAFSDSADFVTFHGDNYDSGTLTLP